MLKKLCLLIGSLTVIGILLTGCATKEVDTDYDVFEQKTTNAKEDIVYKIGETVELDGVQITIDKAYFTKPSKEKPLNNGEILTINLKVYSKPYTKDVYIDESDFLLYEHTGKIGFHYDGYIEQEISGNLSGEKKPDNVVRGVEGKLYFVTTKDQKYELVYKPTFSKKVKEIKFKIIPQ